MAGIYEIWKKVGETPREALERFRVEKGIDPSVPLTFAGRLDPMAEGVMHVLVGEDVHQKDTYIKKDKEYVVEVLVGFHTDTYDLLGMIDGIADVGDEALVYRNISAYVDDHKGSFIQQYPPYSSKTVQGKPLFVWAREGMLNSIIIPSHEVTIYEADVCAPLCNVRGEDVYRTVENKISLVHGDFRQQEILKKWKESIKRNEQYCMIKMNMHVSSGTYVRQYVHDMSVAIGLPLVVFSITRTKIL